MPPTAAAISRLTASNTAAVPSIQGRARRRANLRGRSPGYSGPAPDGVDPQRLDSVLAEYVDLPFDPAAERTAIFLASYRGA